jgi:hypothetical protein
MMITNIKGYVSNHVEDIECIIHGVLASGVIWMIGKAIYNTFGM